MHQGDGDVTWRPYGRHGTLFEFADESLPTRVFGALQRRDDVEECIPGQSTLYVASSTAGRDELLARVQAAVRACREQPAWPSARLHHIDVDYDGADLAGVAQHAHVSVAEVVRLHTAATYTVAFLGFTRGFPYLRGLDRRLVVPRRATPRPSVPAGSVAIAAGFAGIYPARSPGGWQLIGHTTVELFDEHRDPPNLLAVGDTVRFRDRCASR